VRKTQTQILSIVTVILIGFTMFSMANATTPTENKIAGAAFLAENAKKPNIVTTASGLQYEVLTPGTGTASPSATDNVTVHYKGTTLDGEEFDSSYSRGEPATFPLNRVIAGWTEGVQLMKEGAKYRFFIPSQLAYGEQGAGRSIGPNAALIFDVELIKIQ
jgi:FKBP-type peptidyl-prolyl cis-trans isomerase FkpA